MELRGETPDGINLSGIKFRRGRDVRGKGLLSSLLHDPHVYPARPLTLLEVSFSTETALYAIREEKTTRVLWSGGVESSKDRL